MKPTADSLIIVAKDSEKDGALVRGYYAGAAGALKPWSPGAPLPAAGPAMAYIWPTKTYSEGMGSSAPADISPEDRAMLRAARKACGGSLTCFKVSDAPAKTAAEHEAARQEASAPFRFDAGYLRDMKRLFAESMTRPNRQDYTWLVTKTFTFNLAIRLFFVLKAVNAGQLPVVRAVLSTSWYQLQDAVFTVFGQTYMKFLGRMTGMVRVFNAPVGDMVFVYFQLCGFEFLNRLVLGPLGENPLVMTPAGLALVFVNILQGMVSGGPLVPAVNQMRRAGVISHPTMMHLYQVTSLTMQFGLFAAFGYQKFYAMLTGGVLVLSWGSYFVFTTFYKDPPFAAATPQEAPAV
jgi:hypothetical protein